MKFYDEDESVDFILSELGPESKVDKNIILDVVDTLYDYYENHDDLEIDFDEDDDNVDFDSDDSDLDAIVESISQLIELPHETIRRIVVAEQKYQDTLL